MMRVILTAVILTLGVVDVAQAGTSVECAVHAQVRRNQDTGLFRALIKGAIVADGYANKGQKCLVDLIGKSITINIKGNPPEGKTVRLKYRAFYDMVDSQTVTDESWSYWPPGIGDLDPW